MTNRLKPDADLLDLFSEEEIRGSINVVNYYLQFAMDNERIQVSGDSLYILKEGENLLIGNLFDEGFPERKIKKDVFLQFLNRKLSDLSE